MIRERRGRPVVVGDVTLIPIERLTIRSVVVGGVVLFSGSKEPVAVVVQTGGEQFTLELSEPPGPDRRPPPITPSHHDLRHIPPKRGGLAS